MKTIMTCVIAALALMALPGCRAMTFTVGGAAEAPLWSTVVERDGHRFSKRVAIVDVSGLIYNFNRPGLLGSGENPVSLLTEKLEEARTDSRIKAVILRINSPGGTVTASDAMYREVRRFRERSGKPVVVLMMDVAASGGYYVACAGDAIVAYPSSVIGSIGVIIQTISFKPALDRWGIEARALTSGSNKEAGSPLSTLTKEHRAMLQGLVDDFYQQFTAVVRERRPNIAADKFDTLTDGRVVTGRDAVTLGLADQAGDLHDAFALARKMAGLEHADLVIYHRPLDYVGSPYASSPAPAAANTPGGVVATQINLAQINLGEGVVGTGVGVYYLWQPE